MLQAVQDVLWNWHRGVANAEADDGLRIRIGLEVCIPPATDLREEITSCDGVARWISVLGQIKAALPRIGQGAATNKEWRHAPCSLPMLTLRATLLPMMGLPAR